MGAGPNSIKPVDLRRPRIPRAAPLPKIPGPRGGPAYRPHPHDMPKNDNGRLRRTYGIATLADPKMVHPIMPLTLASGFAIFCADVIGLL